MIDTKNILRLSGVLYAVLFGSLFTFAIHAYWPDMRAAVFLPVSGAVFVAFYIVGMWVGVRNEQNKKLPTSSKELRRRTKEFYDSLDSQGRPR